MPGPHVSILSMAALILWRHHNCNRLAIKSEAIHYLGPIQKNNNNNKIAIIGLKVSNFRLSPETARRVYEGLSHISGSVNDHSFRDEDFFFNSFPQDNHDYSLASANEQVDRVYPFLTPGCL